MQQGITRRDVYEPTLTATIGGRDVELVSASIDRMLPDPVAGGSLTAASGELVTVEGPDATTTVTTPWDPGSVWPPVPQSPASVSMDTGAGPVSLLANGVVMSASGGTSGREVDVEVSDAYESLNRTISWNAVSRAVPSLEDRGNSRFVSMLTSSITDLILRHCGWYATPPNLSWNTLEVPAMGTMWPTRGTVTASGRETDVNYGGYPNWHVTPWGVGVGDCRAEYRMAAAYSLADQGRIELTAMTTASESGWSHLAVQTDSGAGMVRMLWSGTQAVVQVRGTLGTYTEVARTARTDGFLYATVERVSSSSVYAIIRSGSSTASAVISCDPRVTSESLRNVQIISQPGSGAGGFQVAFPATTGLLAGWSPNAVQYVRGPSRNHLMVRRSVAGENCADFLQRMCEADAQTYWIDETGVLRWWDMYRLEQRSTQATLTSDDDITDAGFTWEHSLMSRRSRTSVKWEEPLMEWSWTETVDLWQGSGSTLQPGEVSEDWINVPADEEWLMVDTGISRAPGSGSLTDFNYGWGSWYGARGDRGDGVDTWAQLMGSGSLLMTVERVNDRAFKTWLQWTGSVPVMQKTISMDGGGSLWRARRDVDLPILRGKQKFSFTDQITYSAQSGPSAASEHEVDAGWLIQFPEQAQYIADYYGARVTIPQPVLSSIGLVPVPGLQLGDMVEVRDEHIARLTIRGVVIADSRSINADMDMQHSVAIRPLYVTRNGVLWQEWGRAVGGDQYQEWGSRQSGKTYQQWGANPLLGEDVI